MQKILSTPKLIAGIATTLFAASLVTTLFISNANKSLKNNLSTEKLNSEKLLAEKLSLDKEIADYNKEIDQFKLDIDNLKGKNNGLDNLLADSQKKLSEKQAELKKLTDANAGKKVIEKKLEELRKMRDDYVGQIALLNNEAEILRSDKVALSERNNALSQQIAALETANKELAENNQLLKIMAADDYLAEGLKGKKDKLTLNAKKTNKLILHFEIPEDITPNLKFNIIAPDGKKNDQSDINISTTILEPEQNIKVSGTGQSAMKLTKRIKMEYDPKEKFSSGIYTIEIFNNDNYLGRCQVHLK